MIPLKQADAVFTFQTNITPQGACNESGAGANTPNCFNGVGTPTPTVSQTPPDNSNVFSEIINLIVENDCDESRSGDNTPTCINIADYPIDIASSQRNTPGTTPGAQTNVIDILTDDDFENDCNESGNGNNNPLCTNSAFTGLLLNSIDQQNDASSDPTNVFDQDNNVEVVSAWNFDNTCDETDDGNNLAECDIDASHVIGPPVDQTNTAIGIETASFDQENDFEPVNLGAAENDCDESGTGDNTALCANEATNQIESVTQDNTADGSGDATFEQVNEFDPVQEYDLANDCNETDAGVNDATCDNSFPGGSENFIGATSQLNTAVGSESADVDQENRIDSEDSDIPGVSQVLVEDNTCGESGTGDNSVECDSEAFNQIGSLSQTNTVDDATGTSDVFQDNIGIMSQVNVAGNDCDESNTGINDAVCHNDFYSNAIVRLDQSNTATALENTFVSQDNIADTSQSLERVNNCDESGTGDNNANCTNINDVTENLVGLITQTSTADGSGDSEIEQDNEVEVDQESVGETSCDEIGTGTNNAFCENTVGANYVSDLTQTNEATGIADAASIGQDNDIAIFQDTDLDTGCDEADTGDNSVGCTITAFNLIGNFIGPGPGVSQTNTAAGLTADQEINQINDALLSQDLTAISDCDESGTGDNLAECGIGVFNNIRPITQENTADADTADGTYRNAVNIHQALRAVNDCDDSGAGNNEADCIIVVSNQIGEITQTNTGAVPGSQNRLTIDQNIDVENDCDNTASTSNTQTCTFTGSLIVPDIDQTDGESLTIRQNVDARLTCSEGGICPIDISETFVVPLAAAQRTPTAATTNTATPVATTTNSDGEGANSVVAAEDEDASEEGQVAALSLASLTPQDTNNDNDNNAAVSSSNNNNNDISGQRSSGQTAEVAATSEDEDEDEDKGSSTNSGDESDSGTASSSSSSSSSGSDDEEGDGESDDGSSDNRSSSSDDSSSSSSSSSGGDEDEEEGNSSGSGSGSDSNSDSGSSSSNDDGSSSDDSGGEEEKTEE